MCSNMASSRKKALHEVCKEEGIILKEKQTEVIMHLLKQRSVFAALPTGYGKSETFGLLPIIHQKLDPSSNFTCLVVTPLKSITADQIHRWRLRGMRCEELLRKGECTEDQFQATKDRLHAAHLIFAAPEALQENRWWTHLRQKSRLKIGCLVVDEAHTLIPWGCGFREDFLKVPDILAILERNIPVLALTGTACSKMVAELQTKFDVRFDLVSLAPDRPNVHLCIESTKESFQEALEWYLKDLEEHLENADKTIIYCKSVNLTGDLHEEIVLRLGMRIYAGEVSPETLIAEQYHATSTDETKERVLSRFRSPKTTLRCVIATVAFGMGVDIPDIRQVIHWGPPNDIHTYWQEIGRAGRDNKASRCILYKFPGSVIKGETKDEMQDLIHAAELKCCIRISVLKALQVSSSELNGWKRPAHCCSGCNP